MYRALTEPYMTALVVIDGILWLLIMSSSSSSSVIINV